MATPHPMIDLTTTGWTVIATQSFVSHRTHAAVHWKWRCGYGEQADITEAVQHGTVLMATRKPADGLYELLARIALQPPRKGTQGAHERN